MTLILTALLTACAAGPAARGPDPSSVEMEGFRHVDDLYVVDCLLPGEVRQMGRMTYLTPRRPIKTTAFDCRIRGGEYVAYDRADYRSALRVWQARAEEGDAEAQVMVGEIYEKGLGTPPDHVRAAEWYRKAVEQGNQRAMTNLAYLYEQGLGVEQDMAAAINLYRKAAGDAGDDLMFASAAREQNEKMRARLEQELGEARAQQRALARQIEDLQGRLGQQQSQRAEDRETIAALQKLLADTNSRLAEKSERLDRLQTMELPGSAAARGTRDESRDEAGVENLARREEALTQREQELARREVELQAEIQARRESLAEEQSQAREEIQARREALAAEEARIEARLAERRESLSQEESLARDDVAEREAALAREEAQAREELRAREAALAQEEARLEDEARSRREALAREEAAARREAEAREAALSREQALVAEEAQEAEARQRELDRREAALAEREEALARREETLELSGEARQAQVAERVEAEPARQPEPTFKLRENMDFGRYYALVIGLQDYQYWEKLESARRDADRIAELLGNKYGFETKVLHDAGAIEILAAINDLRGRATKQDNILIYFAGRGQLRRPVEDAVVGYWLPVDAQREMTTLWLPNSQINEQIALLEARSVLVVADSCFAGAMSTDPASLLMGGGAELSERRIKLGLERRARYTLSSGGLHPVPDPREGDHSIFARAMIDVLNDNEGLLSEQQLIQRLTGRVTERAERLGVEQRPELRPVRAAGHVPGGSFYLVPRGARAASLAPDVETRGP